MGCEIRDEYNCSERDADVRAEKVQSIFVMGLEMLVLI